MDLISREDVITIATSSCLDLDSYDDTDEFCNEVKELPSAFEGMTNGGVIISLYPDLKYTIQNGRVITTIGVASSFDLEWWNSPYKKGE